MFSPLRTIFRRLSLSPLFKPKSKILTRSLQAVGLTFILGLTSPLYKLDNQIKNTQSTKEASTPFETTIVCDSTEIKEGNIRQVKFPNGRKVIIVRYKGKLHAVGGECTFDQTSPLSEGICFGDKLFCCNHGCAYDVETGRVQLPPAINDLPRFFVEQKNGKVLLYTPHKMPIAIEPLAQGRDYTDMRKVVIIGNGMATLGCIQGLRQNGYTGEIQVISNQIQYPYNDQVLMRSFSKKYEKSQKLNEQPQPRDEKWYKSMGVQFIFNQNVVDIDGKDHYPFLTLNGDIKIEYDGLLIASGTDPRSKKIKGLSRDSSTFLLNQKQDYQDLSNKLLTNKIKDLVVLGYNPKSLRFIKTIHQQFPNVTITVIDPNQKNVLEERLGPQLSLLFVEDQAKHGIRFYLRIPLERVQRSQQKMKIVMKHNQQVKTDAIVMFPNNQQSRSLRFSASKTVDLDMTNSGVLKTDKNCRTSNRQIFAAGKGSDVHYFYGQQFLPCLNNRIAYQEGYTAAYNILALNIPYHMVPFETISSISKQVNLVGYNQLYDDIHLIGDVSKWDFVVLYSLTGHVVGVATTPSQKRAAGIFEQAFREQIIPSIKQFKNGDWTIDDLEVAIRRNKKAGCYKDPIDDIRETYKVNQRDILWMHRDVEGVNMRVKDQEIQRPSYVDKDGYVKQAQRQ